MKTQRPPYSTSVPGSTSCRSALSWQPPGSASCRRTRSSTVSTPTWVNWADRDGLHRAPPQRSSRGRVELHLLDPVEQAAFRAWPCSSGIRCRCCSRRRRRHVDGHAGPVGGQVAGHGGSSRPTTNPIPPPGHDAGVRGRAARLSQRSGRCAGPTSAVLLNDWHSSRVRVHVCRRGLVVRTVGGRYGNVRAALEWAAASEPCAGLRMLAETKDLFFILGQADGSRLAEMILERCPERNCHRAEAADRGWPFRLPAG